MTDQTNLLDSISVLSEAAAATAAPLILGVSPTIGATTSLTTVSDELTFTGSAVDGSTVTIYDGTTALGAVTANAQGDWSFATTAPLSDGAHAFSATATASGVTSAESAATDVTVNSDIGSFSSLTDQWSTPISVDGSPYYVENANVNGNAPWAITEVDDHTLQFTLKPGDLWADNDSSRSEIGGETNYAANSVLNVSYQLTVQPGAADPNLDWLILGQVHADDNSSIVQSLSADYPVFAFHLTSATGHKGGDYLGIQAFDLPSGSNNPQSVTSSNGGYLYLSPTPIVRGSAYSIQVEGSFQDNANGFVDVWINGVQVVAYHGPIGYGSSNYWKEGVYEGYTQTQPITVDYANTVVSSGPYTSGQVTVAYYLANQAALDAAGSVTISDTAAAVSSAIDTINADTHVSAITLLGTPQLDLTVAQALGDTLALNAITNSSYGITVADTAVHLDALSTTQIAEFAAEGVTELHATDADLSLTLAQREALASDGIYVLQPHSGSGTESVAYNASGALSTLNWLGVTGRTFSSRESVYNSAGAVVANAADKVTGAGALTLFASDLTISDAANSLSVTAGADTFALDFHRRETIDATGFGSETFKYAFGFGHQTITGFDAAAIGGDALSLGLSMFSGLSILNTVAADAAILLSTGAMAQAGSAVTITDKRGETITLEGETTTALIQSASSVFKFA